MKKLHIRKWYPNVMAIARKISTRPLFEAPLVPWLQRSFPQQVAVQSPDPAQEFFRIVQPTSFVQPCLNLSSESTSLIFCLKHCVFVSVHSRTEDLLPLSGSHCETVPYSQW